MEMRLGDNLNDDLFIYGRSRFRSAVVAVIVTSMMTAGLGIFVWPVLRDMLQSQFNTLQTIALLLGGALIAMGIIWLYFIIRMLVTFRFYFASLRQRRSSAVLASTALGIAVLFIAFVPIAVLILEPIA